MDPLNILILEPYYGGSHRAFVDTFEAHTCHNCTSLTLPARKWKWRMRGSAIWFSEQISQLDGKTPDLIFTNDMTSVSDLRALLPRPMRSIPIVCFFHENQLTYPLSDNDWRDYQYGFSNILSALASDAAWFNSAYHREAFLEAAGGLLQKMPDFTPLSAVSEIQRKSEVFWLPVAPPPEYLQRPQIKDTTPIRILWPHRWEYDKAPQEFFEVLFSLADQGLDFELVVLGESFREAPGIFGEAWHKLDSRIIHRGYAEDKNEYWKRLLEADLVVSTAIQENFGIAVVEAMLAGCRPLFPNRLAYPEILPEPLKPECLYESRKDLESRLRTILKQGRCPECNINIRKLALEKHSLDDRIMSLDRGLSRVNEALMGE